MKTRSPLSMTLFLFVLLATALAGAAEAAAPSPPAFPTSSETGETHPAVGAWSGALHLPGGGELAVRVQLAREVPGASDADPWSGTIDIPAQGHAGLALEGVSVDGADVTFAIAGIPGRPTFRGSVSEAGDTLSGDFSQGGQHLKFHLDRAADGEEGEAMADAAAPPPIPEGGLPGEGVAGHWLGSLDVGPAVLRLALEVEAGDDGLSATVISLDQGNTRIAVDRVGFEEGTLTLGIDRIGGSYEGAMTDDGSAIAGTWTQGGQSRDLAFLRQAEAFAARRPQEPQGPVPYSTRDVTFPGGDDVELAGTVVVPEGEGPFPAVVFATGSGPQDRDESLMGHRPFLVLADHLARHGIASLRYDDRGFGASGGDHFGSTVDDFAEDLAGGLAYLRAQPEVEGRPVGLLGHSEGGMSAAMVSAAGAPADFLVLLAPPAVPLTDLLVRQARDLYTQAGVDADLLDRVLAQQEEDLALMLAWEGSREALRETALARSTRQVEELSEAERQALGISIESLEQSVRQTTTAWFLSLLAVDPAESLRQVDEPVLALFGAKDLQVAAEENAAAMRRALEAAGNDDFEVEVFAGLNHLFQHAETGAVAEYGTLEETVAPQVLERVSDWIGGIAGVEAGPAADAEAASPGDRVVGHWQGTLEAGGARHRLGLEVRRGAAGLEGALIFVDQGGARVPGSVELEDGRLTVTVDAVQGVWSGTLAAAGEELDGTWRQAGQNWDLAFARQSEPAGPRRPQNPTGPLPYATRDVRFPGGDGAELAGTVVVPEGDGPFPAVVFATGSGPQDRDESLMGHRPFLVFADHLARHGIASLRFDDRGFGESTGDYFASTVDDFAEDVAAALAYLRRQPEVDGARVGVLGHSEGGVYATQVAAAGEPVDFLVLLASPAVSIPRLLDRQHRDLYRQSGAQEALIDRLVRGLNDDVAWMLEGEREPAEVRQTLLRRNLERLEATSPAERQTLGMNAQQIEGTAAQMGSQWFQSLVRIDPAESLSRIDEPVLALFGTKDLQVAAEENAAVMRRALEAADNDGFEIEVLAGLNHLFQHAETGALAEYAEIEETVAPQVLERVSDWILARQGEDGEPRAAAAE